MKDTLNHQKHVMRLLDIDHWDVEDEDWLYSVNGLIAEEEEDVNRKYNVWKELTNVFLFSSL